MTFYHIIGPAFCEVSHNYNSLSSKTLNIIGGEYPSDIFQKSLRKLVDRRVMVRSCLSVYSEKSW